MTAKKQRAHAELIKAWSDGETIQFLVGESEWADTDEPLWYADAKYRIKPVEKWAPSSDVNFILTSEPVKKFAILTSWMIENSNADSYKIEFTLPEIPGDHAMVSFTYYAPIEDIRRLRELINGGMVVL